MEFVIQSGAAETQTTDCLVVSVYKEALPTTAANIDSATEGYLTQLLSRGDLILKAGNSLMLLHTHHTPFERLLLVALGEKQAPLTEGEFKKVAADIAAQLTKSRCSNATIALADIAVKDKSSAWVARQLTETMEYAHYSFTQFKSNVTEESVPTLESITFISDDAEVEKAVREGQAIAMGRNVTRTLGNLPPNVCHPTYLAEQAEALAAKHDKLTTTVLGEDQMRELGMHSLLSVSAGSDQEAKLICMSYSNGAKDAKPYVILGKGITFDTGGISLKPGLNMDEMKFDMCGAASVFGVMNAIIELELPLNVIGMVASAENMPSGKASRPGDIVTSMSGKTIEILNTDAEGRLILCDALTYAERFEPAAVVDIATLTGACVVALGHHTTGVLSNDDQLAQQLLSASNEAMDRAWQLPMGEEYTQQLDSNFADLANIGGPAAGTITAACFLAKFTEAYPWAHLDIAGTASKSGKEKGATGRPVPMLVQYLLNQC